MTEPLPLPRSTGRRALLLVLLVVVLVVATIRAMPPTALTIETGPVGGSYHQVALLYRDALARHGITVEVKAQPNSMEIVRNVATAGSGSDVGFIAQDVDDMIGQPVATLGQIQLQPLFIFASANLGRRSSLDDLRGRRIVMPPKDSATSAAAIRMLELYDITDENSSFTFMQLAEAAKQLQAGAFDAGVFMLAPENALIKAMAADSSLRLMPYPEARAIANHLPFLRAVVLPRGIYNIADAIPPHDTPLIAATVGVVVKPDLHPYLIYALLEAMTSLHRPATFLSAAGTFPTLDGAQLPAHPIAQDYFKVGLPWAYRDLPPWLASAVDRYDTLALMVLLVCAVIVLIGPVADLIGTLIEVVALAAVRRIARAMSRTGRISSGQRRRLDIAERILRRSDSAPVAGPVIAAIRARAQAGGPQETSLGASRDAARGDLGGAAPRATPDAVQGS